MTVIIPTVETPQANPVAVVLKFLGAAWNANQVEWTSVPADCRPPQVVIGAGTEAEIRAFVAAVEALAGLFSPPPRQPIEPVSTLDGEISALVASGGSIVATHGSAGVPPATVHAAPGQPPHSSDIED